jgi:protein RecA
MDFIEQIYREIGENDFNQDVKDHLSTGLLPLNMAISGKYDGGFPVGRITEVFGGESSGKTLLATMALIETQKRDGLAVFLDYEHAFSLSRGKKLGLSDDKYKWIYKQPTTAEEGFRIVEFIAKTVRDQYPDKFVTIIKDSIASMVTKEEMETEYGDGNMRTRLSLPAVMSESLKKVAGIVSKTNITLIFLNQTRDNPGVMFGDKKKTPGGNAMKFFASVRMKLAKTGKIKDEGEVIGENVKAQTVKNKVYEPFKECDYVSHFTNGINLEMSHIETLSKMGKLGDKKGFVVFDGKSYRKGQLCEKCQTDPAIYEALLGLFYDEPEKKAA